VHARGFRSFDLSEEKTIAVLPADTERLVASVLPSVFPPGLRWLSLTGAPGVSARCDEIAPLPPVRVGLSHTDADAACVERLSQHASVERIDLSHTRATDKGVSTLVQLPLLSALSLSGTKVSDVSVTLLLDRFALKRLDVDETRVQKAAKIARTTSLE